MAIRRRTYRRRPIRRRRFIRRRRIMKPIGSGMQGKRFMKLKQVFPFNSNPSAPYNATFLYDNPNGASEFASAAILFDSYRVCAMKVKYIPFCNVQSIDDAIASSAVHNVPIYCAFDYNSILNTVPTSIDPILEYENLQIKSLLRTWQYYKKCRRNIPINTSLTTQVSIQNKAYIPTNTPVATQTMWFVTPSWGSGTTAIQIGYLICYYYCVFKDRR